MIIDGQRVTARLEEKLVLPFGDDGHPGWITMRSYIHPGNGRRCLLQKRDGMTRTVVL